MTENDKAGPAQAPAAGGQGASLPDPASAWPFPVNQDLGAGDELDVLTELEASDLFREARARRAYRHGAVGAALVVLTVLLVALVCVISTFVGQVKSAPKVIAEKVLEAPLSKASGSASGAAAPSLAMPSGATSAAASASGTGVAAPGATQPKWTTSVSVDTTSIANSVVAIASILVVAVVVLAIALVKATFSMESPHTKTDGDAAKKVDNGIDLPGVEIIKAVGEALSSTLKAVAGDGKK